MYFIYKITNNINNKIYVGQTNDFKHRWVSHKSHARNKPTTLIDSKIKQYGDSNFSYDLIETCATLEEVNLQEEWYIKIMCSHVSIEVGYNIDYGGKANKQISEETRKKLIESHLGKIVSQETKDRISASLMGENNHFYGKKHSEASIIKMKESHKGEKHNWYGKKLSKESIEKRSMTMKSKHVEFCIIDGCNKKYYSKGFCSNHYNQNRIKIRSENNNETIKM